jgi:predicted acyl esterase
MKLRNHGVSSGAVLSLFALLTGFQLAAQQPANPPPSSIDTQWGVKIPVPDGVSLNATIYRPHEQNDPPPVIFTIAPYIGDSYTDRATYFATHGYVYALVDVRNNSGGEFWPFENEGRDGFDVTEWLAKQGYCNGKVTLWGGSYAGFDQWSVDKETAKGARNRRETRLL